MGTSLNRTLVPRLVPLRVFVSSSMRLERNSQAMSSAGQVVNDTPSSVILLCPSSCRLLADPRALRSGNSNSAPSILAPSADE